VKKDEAEVNQPLTLFVRPRDITWGVATCGSWVFKLSSFFHTRITSLGLTVHQKRLAAWFAQTISGNFRGYFRDVDVLTPLA